MLINPLMGVNLPSTGAWGYRESFVTQRGTGIPCPLSPFLMIGRGPSWQSLERFGTSPFVTLVLQDL